MTDRVTLKCSYCEQQRSYIKKTYARRVECDNCLRVIHVPGSKPDGTGIEPCPMCGHMQRYLKTGERRIIRCNACTARFTIESGVRTKHIGKQGRCKSIW